jgi:hypothetical protein
MHATRCFKVRGALGWAVAVGWLLLLPSCREGRVDRATASEHPGTTVDSARVLFDGTSLDGWDGDPRYWRVEDGAITGETTAEAPLERNTFLIARTAIEGDFVLSFEYRVTSEWANSGVQYRSVEWPALSNVEGPALSNSDRWIVGGYQADIDEPVTYTGILYGERDRGILAQRGERVRIGRGGSPTGIGSLGERDDLARAVRGRGEWNSYRIEATGNCLIHTINGVQMIEAVDEDDPATSHDQPGARQNGVVALQLHTGRPMRIQFRNLRVEALSASGARQ